MRYSGFLLFSLGFLGVLSVIYGFSFFVGSGVFASINFDAQLETQWYKSNTPSATVSAMPEPAPLPISITTIISQTRHSH
ncbi:hypothetical protein KBC86_01640 [Candidatus Gracilibacteria bacterium]|nr:hypothetical protein [Candidatus Gracilibacteria bacterium]